MISVSVFALVLLLFAWVLLGGRDEAVEPTARRLVNDSIDYSTLEQAEREVQGADPSEGARDLLTATLRPPIG